MLNKAPIDYFAKVGAGQGAPQKESDFSNEGFPFIRAGHLEDLINGKDELSLPMVNNEVVKKYRLKLYPAGTIIFAKSGMSATKGRIYKLNNPCYIVNHLAVLVLKENAYPDFVMYALRNFSPVKLINDSAYPSINQGAIEKFKIPFPEKIEDQVQIANLLAKGEDLIKQRKESMRLLDEFLKSTFFEIFGDPISNSKKFPTKSGKQVFVFTSGKFNPKENLNDTFKYPCYGGNGINGYSKEYLIDFETIAIGRVGAYCGNVHIVPSKSWITDNAIYIKGFKQKFNIKFYYFLFKLLKFNRFADTVGQPKITQAPLESQLFLDVDFELQNKFAAIVEKAEKLKTTYKESLTVIDNLYGSLSQSAFKGELKFKSK